MSDGTKIEWTDATWNVVNGCSVVSPGCTNCYAMKQAHRFPARQGLTQHSKGGMVWTGEVRFNDAVLLHPLRWKRPRKIFVCAHGDLFHEKVPDAWIDRVFAVMALAPQHIFQVLTKRPERMREYIKDQAVHRCDERGAGMIDVWDRNGTPAGERVMEGPWPLPNVWLGTSVEDQKRADERVPILLDTPAAVRWLSCEPLLGPVDLRFLQPHDPPTEINALEGTHGVLRPHGGRCAKIDWVVAGGESGPGARPMHPDWVRDLRDQCVAAEVAFLFKQWGEYRPSIPRSGGGNILRSGWITASGQAATGPGFSELYPQQGAAFVERVGKRIAGRMLDGREWKEYPTIGGGDGPSGARAVG